MKGHLLGYLKCCLFDIGCAAADGTACWDFSGVLIGAGEKLAGWAAQQAATVPLCD